MNNHIAGVFPRLILAESAVLKRRRHLSRRTATACLDEPTTSASVWVPCHPLGPWCPVGNLTAGSLDVAFAAVSTNSDCIDYRKRVRIHHTQGYVRGRWTCMLHRSRAQTPSRTCESSGLISRQSFSWYSAPQISSTDIVSSPR